MGRTAFLPIGPGLRLLLLFYSLGLIALFAAGVHLTSSAEFPLGGPEDFTIFYTAGRIVGTGDGHRLYDLSYQSLVQQELLQSYGLSMRGGLLPYNYPPFFALPFVPLARLSLPESFLFWYGISLGLVILATLLLLRDLDLSWRWQLLLVVLAVIAFLPVSRGFAKGQSSGLMLFLLTITFAAWKRGHDGIAGATLALAMIKPQLALPIVLVPLLLRRWRSLAAFAMVSMSLLIISGLLVGSQGLVDYVAALRYSAAWTGQPGFYPEVMPNIRGSVYRFSSILESWTAVRLPISLWIAIISALSLTGLAALVHLWRRLGTDNPRSDLDLRFSATIALIVLLSPHVYDHDLALLVLAAFSMVGYFIANNQAGDARMIIVSGHIAPWLAFLILSPAAYAQFLSLGLLALTVILYRSLRSSDAIP
jgi:hypothetical protein